GPATHALARLSNGRVRLGVRPGDVAIVRTDALVVDAQVLPSEVLVVEPAERTLVVTLRADGTDFKMKGPAGGDIRPGDRAQVRLDTARLYLFDPATGAALGRTPAGEMEARHAVTAS